MPNAAYIVMTMVMTRKRRAAAAPRTMTAGEFKARRLAVMDRVAATGDTVVITKRGRPVAQLGPVVRRPETVIGIAGGVLRSGGDVVSPIDVAWEALKR